MFQFLLPIRTEDFGLVFAVILILSLPIQIESLVFNLQSGRTKCISEDLHSHAVTHAHYRINADTPHSYKISARVSDPNGETLHEAQSVESGEFAFTATQAGEHIVCFWSPQFDPSASMIPIEFEWKAGVATNHHTSISILKRDKIQFMELELKKLEESVQSIHEDIKHLREREEEMQMLNQTTNSRMAMMSLLSLFICLGVAGLQLWHLKTFFERKKIL
ncbi:GOLD [Macleaya cordata]|uniref:GOLD n=1 Tax=Macleaya cordata TaxID=56857 RepID=A0A200Q0B5_MACCD|nr:GOLD [Macleaya cordata]